MIRKQEVLEWAGEWNLRPEIVEKDYVLGWLLAAASQHAVIREHWILKGGTCVKKCFFETYRFSEDLDYSLLPTAPYDAASITVILRELAESTGRLSGIRFSPDQFTVKERKDKFGRVTFEGRIGYQGPLAIPNWPRILFDITQHEPVIMPAASRGVLHPYSDHFPDTPGIRTYAFEELLAEKTRALFERTRPRDLYDVVYILDNLQEPLDAGLIRTTFVQKCRTKRLEPPTAVQIIDRVRASDELRADWNDMLAHQLPYPVPIDGALERLDRALEWLAEQQPAQIIGTSATLSTPAMAAAGGQRAVPQQIHGGTLEQLRFAGANRLLVGFTYSGETRVAEPYSLRFAETTGNLNFYGWELASQQIKCFTVSKMSAVRVLEQTFAPRHHIELATQSAISHGPWRW